MVSETGYAFAPQERPTFAGSPFTPGHPALRRMGYAMIAILAGVGSTLGNGLVNVNVASLAGSIGLYTFEASLLPAIYVAFNASANLMLIKARAQFGIPQITQGLLACYAVAAAFQFVAPGFATAVLIRAVCGMTAAALITFSIYNWMQALPAKLRPVALVLGIGIPQLGPPLARMFPVEMLASGDWQSVHLAELAIAAILLTVSTALPLPPSERSRAFQPLDFVTFALALTGMLLLCCALGEGRLLWWTDTPWLGMALAGSVAAFACATIIELRRSQPLLQLHWIGSIDILRFAAVALLVRLALAEQTFGAVGLLASDGLTSDQLHGLFAIIVGAMVAGIVVAALTLSEKRIPWQVMTAALIIAAGAWIDTDATNLTRPPQLYLSQALIAFGTTLFIGPALIYGFLRMFQKGGDHLVSFVVLFSTTQNVGGLIGSALLGTYQVAAMRYYVATLSEHLTGFDPQVATRIQAGAAGLGGVIGDPALQSVQGAALLSQAMTREGGILAYNDVFRAVAVMAMLTAGYVAYLLILARLRTGTAKPLGASL